MCIGTGAAPVAYDLGQAGRWSQALAVADAARREGYQARLAGKGRVAGHAAQVVEVAAADPWRYGYRLWIERESGLPLRVDLVDSEGLAVEQIAFTELELGVRPADVDLKASASSGLNAVESLPAVDRAAPGWHVPVPPPGFALRAARYRPEGVQLLYSDGLASVSVYIEKAGPGLRGASATRRGAVHARSFWVDGWHVLAIGKVPAAHRGSLRARRADGARRWLSARSNSAAHDAGRLHLRLLGPACDGCQGGCAGRCNLFATDDAGDFTMAEPEASTLASVTA